MNSGVVSNNRGILKNIAIILLVTAIVFALSACGASEAGNVLQNRDPTQESDQTPVGPGTSGAAGNDGIAPTDAPDGGMGDINGENAEGTAVPKLKMKIDGQELAVIWEDNESVDALIELASVSPVRVEMSMYGGFEQVGSLGTGIPRNDVQTTTQAGDIVLYSGDRIVVFYGSNSWAYTRLGRIGGMSRSELEDLLSRGPAELILYTE